MVKTKEDWIPFERTFHSFWQKTKTSETEEAISISDDNRSKVTDGQSAKAERGTQDATSNPTGRQASESAATATYSPVEVLMKRDLTTLRGDDLEQIQQILMKVAHNFSSTKTHTMHPDKRGAMDLRRTVRTNMQFGTELLKIMRRRKRLRRNRLVLICDVSGSMKAYGSFAIQYLYAIGKVFERVEVFLFSTQLTRVTTELRRGSFETTMKLMSDSVLHWGGGTKIGACLDTLLERYGHMISRRTTVMIISDGMDTGDITLLGETMRRLKQRSRWVAWLNPLLADPTYEPICRGMQAALPHINMFTSANNLLEFQKFTQMLGHEPTLRVRR